MTSTVEVDADFLGTLHTRAADFTRKQFTRKKRLVANHLGGEPIPAMPQATPASTFAVKAGRR